MPDRCDSLRGIDNNMGESIMKELKEMFAKFFKNVLGVDGALHLLVCLWLTIYGFLYGFSGGLIGAGVAVGRG